MDQQIVIFGSLASTMLLLGIALAIAWSGFGRRRHAADWAMAFLAMALGYGVVLVRWCLPDTRVGMSTLASALCALCSALIAIGFRRRAGLGGVRAIGGAAVAVVVVTALLEYAFPARAYYRVLVNGFAAVTAFVAACALLRRGEARDGAQRAARHLLSGYGLFCGALTALSAYAAPNGPFPEETYRLMFLLGAPTGLTGIGLAAMMLIASDLAEDLRRLATVDPLTGVLNRRGVEAAAKRMLADCRRGRRPMTLVLADLDRFKSINDRFGHTLGDAVLHCFAQHCDGAVRCGDVVGRLGGEEFIILMPGATPRIAAEAMDRLRAGLSPALAASALPTAVTASFGIATSDGGGDSLAAMIDRADAALFGSKDDGRDRISFAPAAHATEPRFADAFARAS